MSTFIASYCAVNEDGPLHVDTFQESDFVLAARTAVARAPEGMKIFKLEEEARVRNVTPIPRRSLRDNDSIRGLRRTG